MARGAKTLSARPPPQAWLANCLDPTARVVTVSAKELGAMIEAREAKTPKAAPRATAKRSRETGSAGAKYTVTEQAGFVWVTCGTCAKKRYALETFRVGGEEDTTGFKCESMRDDSRPDVCCDTPEDSFPRDTYNTKGAPPPPPGWRREVIPRKTVHGADAYYYSPCGKRMRSKPDVQRFLDKCHDAGKYIDVSIDSFDFSTGGSKPAKTETEEAPAKKAKKGDEEDKEEKTKKKGDEEDKEEKKKKKRAKTTKEDVDVPVKRGRGRPKRAVGNAEDGDTKKEEQEKPADVEMEDAL